MKTVTTFDELIAAYAADNELCNIDLPNDDDEALVNVMAQIHIGIFDDSSHYGILTAKIIETEVDDSQMSTDLRNKIIMSVNRIMRLCIETNMKLNENMILYYCAKSCEDYKIGDMLAGGNTDDDIFIKNSYEAIKRKALMYNVYGWTPEQRIAQIDIELEQWTKEHAALAQQITKLANEKQKLLDGLAAISK